MTAVAVLLVGLYAFAATHWDFDVLALALPAVKVSAKFLWIQVGWPLFGFGLMALPLLAMSFQRLVAGRGLSPHQRLWLSHIECNAYALGILGSIIHLLSTGKANNGTLQGLGSLAMGLVFWIWCLWIGFETSVEEPAQSSDLSTEE